MRSSMLLAAGLGLLGGLAQLSSLPSLAADQPGANWKCGGSTNCLVDTCIQYPPGGYSCANVTPIDHKKCGIGTYQDCCKTIQVDCVELNYHGGAQCSGNPAACYPSGPVGMPMRFQEDGCDPAQPCNNPPGGTG